MQTRNIITAVIGLALGSLPCIANTTASVTASQPSATQPSNNGDKVEGKPKATSEEPSVTKHEITIQGSILKYRATAGTMPMEDEQGKLKAKVFFVAYEKETDQAIDVGPSKVDDATFGTTTSPVADPAKRPLTFVFNGGPGAAAVWLHLGTAGPRRISLEPDGQVPAPPYRLTENGYTWLDTTDLVFIDPVGTGFSRPAKDEKREQFYGTKADINWVADFIRLYVTKYERWLSPQFLAGESYGTTRAAGLSEYLLDRYGIALNGIILISSVLDFQTILLAQNSNDLPYILYLPTYAASAWYHKKLSDDLQADLRTTLQEVERWAIGPYVIALAQDGSMDDVQREKVAQRLARYTGLPVDFVRKSNLRVDPHAFQKLLLANQGKLTGRFDARITGFDSEPTWNYPPYDPSLSQYFAIYSTTFNDYVRRTLEYKSVLPYEVLSEKVRPWKFEEQGGKGYLSVADNLRSAMVKNPHLKIMFASGYFDLATPYFATCYTVNHLNLHPELRGNITKKFYMGGHMMYHNRASLQRLKADVAAFIRSALH